MKNIILKILTAVAALGFIISACCLDSNSYIPEFVCFICLAWLVPFICANSDRGWYCE